MAATEQVILVDENDHPIGSSEKLEAHQKGLCHRAFSVFIFRERAELELLLQQRAQKKYHTPNLWTNTCCSHPRPGENILQAGERRLQEEFGMLIPLQSMGYFHYISHFDNGLIENEVDHVLVGLYNNQKIIPNQTEIQNYRWVTIYELKKDLKTFPEKFTPWLEKALAFAEKKWVNVHAMTST